MFLSAFGNIFLKRFIKTKIMKASLLCCLGGATFEKHYKFIMGPIKSTLTIYFGKFFMGN